VTSAQVCKFGDSQPKKCTSTVGALVLKSVSTVNRVARGGIETSEKNERTCLYNSGNFAGWCRPPRPRAGSRYELAAPPRLLQEQTLVLFLPLRGAVRVALDHCAHLRLLPLPSKALLLHARRAEQRLLHRCLLRYPCSGEGLQRAHSTYYEL